MKHKEPTHFFAFLLLVSPILVWLAGTDYAIVTAKQPKTPMERTLSQACGDLTGVMDARPLNIAGTHLLQVRCYDGEHLIVSDP